MAISKKEWGELKDWLATLHPAIRIKSLHLILENLDEEKLVEEAQLLLKEAQEELILSPEWKEYGTPIPAGLKVEDLFPALTGKEETLEEKLPELTPDAIKEHLGPEVELYKGEFDKLKPLSGSKQQLYSALIERAYLRVYSNYNSTYQSQKLVENYSSSVESMIRAAADSPEKKKKLFSLERFAEEAGTAKESLEKASEPVD